MNSKPNFSVDNFTASPNFDERPRYTVVDTLVIHAISLPPDEFGGDYVADFFCNQLDEARHPYFCEIAGLRVSTHFYIQRSGAVTQFVDTEKRAWHAGESKFQQRTRVNDFSIGIELEGCDSVAFEELQYRKLALLSQQIMAAYPDICNDRIVGHSDISPGRKTDPGPCFNWDHYLKLI